MDWYGSCFVTLNPVIIFITVSNKSLLTADLDKSLPIAWAISSALLIVVGVTFL